MAKLACAFSFLILCGLNYFDKSPDIGGATLRLAIAVIFAGALIALVRKEFEAVLG